PGEGAGEGERVVVGLARGGDDRHEDVDRHAPAGGREVGLCVRLEGRNREPAYSTRDTEGHRIECAARPAERAVRLSPREIQLHSRLTVGKPPGTLRWTERGQGQLEIDVRRELERLRDPDLGGAAVDLTREPLEIDARRHEVRLPAEELPGLADGEVDDRR